MHQPALRALVVLFLSSLAEARLSGSFWSPALNTWAVKLLQLDGTSHRGGGLFTIWQTRTTVNWYTFVPFRVEMIHLATRCYHLETQWRGIIPYPWLASIEHVQQHAAAAPHISLGTQLITLSHLGGHVALCARETSSYTHQRSLTFTFLRER